MSGVAGKFGRSKRQRSDRFTRERQAKDVAGTDARCKIAMHACVYESRNFLEDLNCKTRKMRRHTTFTNFLNDS